jgi:hypothetical protein
VNRSKEESGESRPASSGATAGELYRLYDKLDRFEELLEDMAELGVTSIADAERLIAELNDHIDALEARDPREG